MEVNLPIGSDTSYVHAMSHGGVIWRFLVVDFLVQVLE